MLVQILPRAYRNYRSLAIFGGIVDQFSEWCHRSGYTACSIGDKLRDLRYLVRYFERHRLRSCAELTLGHFETAWKRLHLRTRTLGGTIRQLRQFLQQVHGLVPPLPKPTNRLERELGRYREYLQQVRGCAEGTVHSHLRCSRAFLEFIGYSRSAAAISQLSLPRIESFVHRQAKTYNRYSLRNIVGHLRGLLRFLHAVGRLPHALHEAIDTPRIYRMEQLPQAIPWPRLRELLRSIDRRELHGLRDYTMLLLMAAYGLRSSEVVALTLDDIDWRAKSLRITQRKTRRPLILPLTDEVGCVLQQYLRRARPRSESRALFLHLRAPAGPLAPATVNTILIQRIRRSRLAIGRYSTRCLRHGFALRLLRQGVSIKAIGDTLGHRNLDSTGVYLRLAIDDLRGVGLEVPKPVPRTVLLQPVRSSRLASVGQRTRPTAPTRFRSRLGASIQAYLAIKRALGRKYANEARTLMGWDAFLCRRQSQRHGIGRESFLHWAVDLAQLTPTVQRRQMQIVRNFLLFHARNHHHTFIPDLATFPKRSAPRLPRLVSEKEMALVLAATAQWKPSPDNPIRAQTLRIALILLFCCGLRRGELLRLRLRQCDAEQNLLQIEATKFHKSRWVPLSESVARELQGYLELRRHRHLAVANNSCLIWSKRRPQPPTDYNGAGISLGWRCLCRTVGVLDALGRPPRLHDLRHSFALRALQRWYEKGEEVQSKLPYLATYLGHVSPASTHYYLHFTPQLGQAASECFHRRCASLFQYGGEA
jgi:integrase/recombinase XerD